MKIRVYYEDTDAGDIVYHTNYIKYCERARSELFFEREMMPAEDEASGFVVRKIQADFLSTAKLGDILEVTTRFLQEKNTSITLLQSVWKSEIKLFEMEILLVYVFKGRPKRIPDNFRKLFDLYR